MRGGLQRRPSVRKELRFPLEERVDAAGCAGTINAAAVAAFGDPPGPGSPRPRRLRRHAVRRHPSITAPLNQTTERKPLPGVVSAVGYVSILGKIGRGRQSQREGGGAVSVGEGRGGSGGAAGGGAGEVGGGGKPLHPLLPLGVVVFAVVDAAAVIEAAQALTPAISIPSIEPRSSAFTCRSFGPRGSRESLRSTSISRCVMAEVVVDECVVAEGFVSECGAIVVCEEAMLRRGFFVFVVDRWKKRHFVVS